MKIVINERQLSKLVLSNLNEQSSVDTQQTVSTKETKFDTINFGDNFEYGKYQSDEVLNQVKGLRQRIESYIKDNDQASFTFSIVAGESQVTNPQGFETKGSLALARAKEVKKYLDQVFSDLIESKKITIVSPQSVGDVTIGQTPYGGPGSGDNKKPDLVAKYRKEQFVNLVISGKGLKTTTTTTKKLTPKFEICKTPPLVSDGKYISANQDFTNRTKFDLGSGSGQIYFYAETYTMPDIIYLEYNGKSFGSTEFSGADEPWTRLLLGTTLINKYGYGGKLPASFGATTFERITPEDPAFRSALMEAKSWGLKKSFFNIFGEGEALQNPQYMAAFEEFDSRGSIKNLLKSLGPNFVWGTLTSKIGPSIQKNIKFSKVENLNEAVVVNISPNGGTNWNVGITCQPF